MTSCFAVTHIAARVLDFEAQSHAPLASYATRKIARSVRSRRPTRATRSRALQTSSGRPRQSQWASTCAKTIAASAAVAPVTEEVETRVVRGPEPGCARVERQAARPGQRYAVERGNAPRSRAPETSTRRSNARRAKKNSAPRTAIRRAGRRTSDRANGLAPTTAVFRDRSRSRVGRHRPRCRSRFFFSRTNASSLSRERQA